MTLDFPITQHDPKVIEAARQHMDSLVKPQGSLGRLEEVAVWLAACQNNVPPELPRHPTVVIFAGDHGIARTAGTSAYPPEVTAQMVAGFAQGFAAINALGRINGLAVHVVDVSVDSEPLDRAGQLEPADASRVRRASGSIDREDAMTPEEFTAAFDAGRRATQAVIESGGDLLIVGDMGIGNTTAAAAVIGFISGTPAEHVTGFGTGISPETWQRKVNAIERAWERVTSTHGLGIDAAEILRTMSGPDIVAMAGALAEAARSRIPVILDGTVVTAAALATEEMFPGARTWWIAGHRSTEPAHSIALSALELEPLLDLTMRLGEASGAAVAYPIVVSAIACARDMATFEGAGVATSGDDDG